MLKQLRDRRARVKARLVDRLERLKSNYFVRYGRRHGALYNSPMPRAMNRLILSVVRSSRLRRALGADSAFGFTVPAGALRPYQLHVAGPRLRTSQIAV
jgi:hypothetical protein